MKENIKKILLSMGLVGAFVVYAVYQRFGHQNAPVTTPESITPPDQTNTTPIPPSPAVEPISMYKDGAYTGTVADAFYGPLQVKAIIANGKLADVQFLQYPNDRKTSIEISTNSMPILKTEAIQAQSAEVDIVSGATQTSGAFIESLTSALAKAKRTS